MTTALNFSTTRELDSRISDGIHVRLLWCEHEDRVAVAVNDTRSGATFSLEVRDGECPREVFMHPYAYAAWHGVAAVA
jgi:hypothetical protein